MSVVGTQHTVADKTRLRCPTGTVHLRVTKRSFVNDHIPINIGRINRHAQTVVYHVVNSGQHRIRGITFIRSAIESVSNHVGTSRRISRRVIKFFTLDQTLIVSRCACFKNFCRRFIKRQVDNSVCNLATSIIAIPVAREKRN